MVIVVNTYLNMYYMFMIIDAIVVKGYIGCYMAYKL
jgi:hypothetical protein